jgi:hypothetical protein
MQRIDSRATSNKELLENFVKCSNLNHLYVIETFSQLEARRVV